MSGFGNLFRDIGQTVVGLFQDGQTATLTIQTDAYDPSTASRPTTNEQIYTVPVSPAYSQGKPATLDDQTSITVFVAAKDVDAAVPSSGPSTPIAPRVSAKVELSGRPGEAFRVVGITQHDGGATPAGYELELAR